MQWDMHELANGQQQLWSLWQRVPNRLVLRWRELLSERPDQLQRDVREPADEQQQLRCVRRQLRKCHLQRGVLLLQQRRCLLQRQPHPGRMLPCQPGLQLLLEAHNRRMLRPRASLHWERRLDLVLLRIRPDLRRRHHLLPIESVL
jgi:hypothetical protein